MNMLRPAAAVLALLVSSAHAATPEQDCRAFSRQDLAVTMHYRMGEFPRGWVGMAGRFGDFSAVVAQCRAALALAPGDAGLQLEYARALLAQAEFPAAAEALQPLVQAGQPTALRLYGVLRHGGFSVPFDVDQARQILARAAELGDPVAPLVLAMFSLAANEPEAAYRALLLRSVEAGYAPAEYFASMEAAGGKLTGFTTESRLRWLQDAAAKGWPPAMSVLAGLLRDGKLLPRDPQRAEALERAAGTTGTGNRQDFTVHFWEFG